MNFKNNVWLIKVTYYFVLLRSLGIIILILIIIIIILIIIIFIIIIIIIIIVDFLKHKQANINVKSRCFVFIVTPFSR